jgi:sugar lactone lactonase YvrE
VLVAGFGTTESPRWRDGRLYFSDMAGHTVQSVTPAGELDHIADVPGTPGGLGWLPDGRLLIVSQTTRELMRCDGEELVVHADLAGYGSSPLNDMWVDALGRAYVGEMGFDIHAFHRLQEYEKMAAIRMGHVYIVEADGTSRVGTAEGLLFPNGIAVDGTTQRVVIAESFRFALSSFAVAPSGELVDGRLQAQLGFAPDGIAVDDDGWVWVADPVGRRAVRVSPDGQICDVLELDRMCLALALGGADGRSLFLCTTDATEPEKARTQRSARIEVVHLEVDD